MRSVGINLQQWVDGGLLKIWAEHSTAYGLEEHLGRLDRLLEEFSPRVAVLDAMRSLTELGPERNIHATFAMEIDMLKSRQITTVITSLTHRSEDESSAVGVSSLTDSWLFLRNVEVNGERIRLLFVIKSRGMAHSNQVREFKLTSNGPQLVEVMINPRGTILTGSARQVQVDRFARIANNRLSAIKRNQIVLQRRTAVLQAEIAVLENELEAASADLEKANKEQLRRQAALEVDQAASEQIREV
jgi:circadian clock protein KaiC